MKFIIPAALVFLAACSVEKTEAPYVDPVPEAAAAYLEACLASQAGGEVISPECLCAIEAANGGQCEPTGTVIVETQAESVVEVPVEEVVEPVI